MRGLSFQKYPGRIGMKKANGDDIFFVDPMILSRVTQIVDDTSPLIHLKRPSCSWEDGTPWHSLAAFPFQRHAESILTGREPKTIIPTRICSFSLHLLLQWMLKAIVFGVNHFVEKKSIIGVLRGGRGQFKPFRGAISCHRTNSTT